MGQHIAGSATRRMKKKTNNTIHHNYRGLARILLSTTRRFTFRWGCWAQSVVCFVCVQLSHLGGLVGSSWCIHKQQKKKTQSKIVSVSQPTSSDVHEKKFPKSWGEKCKMRGISQLIDIYWAVGNILLSIHTLVHTKRHIFNYKIIWATSFFTPLEVRVASAYLFSLLSFHSLLIDRFAEWVSCCILNKSGTRWNGSHSHVYRVHM